MNITVENDAEAAIVIARVMASLEDWSTFFALLNERVLPDAQRRQWDQHFGLGLTAELSTVNMRAKRLGYYRVDPNDRATPGGPYLEWTGSLRHATDTFTEIGPLRATIDPHRNYEGPLSGKLADPFSVVTSRVPESAIWDLAYLDRVLDDAIDGWVQSHVLARLAA